MEDENSRSKIKSDDTRAILDSLANTQKNMETKSLMITNSLHGGVADMTMDDAKDVIMATAEDDYRHELALKYRDMEESTKNEANDKARMILGQAIQRLASDVVSEATVSTVPIPSDDMKGRLIGREGRNIRSIE